jgi:hypothetical protein
MFQKLKLSPNKITRERHISLEAINEIYQRTIGNYSNQFNLITVHKCPIFLSRLPIWVKK